MALVDVKWAPGYVYETETEISALPQEISFAMTGTRMRLVEGGAFEMGLSTQRWQEFMDRVIACAGSELPDLPPWEDSRHPRSVFGKSKDGSLCVHLPSVRDIVGHFIDNPGITAPHRVYLDPYYIDVRPASEFEYDCFFTDLKARNGCPLGRCKRDSEYDQLALQWSRPPRKPHESKPAKNLLWHAADAYAWWRGAQLPTEAQWEKAARGCDGALFPWGDELPSEPSHHLYAKAEDWQYRGDAGPKSSCGCHQMVVGIWEWCAEWFCPTAYAELPEANPNANFLPEYLWTVDWGTGDNRWRRSLRGGQDLYGFVYPCANRWHHSPIYCNDDFGVRCVLPVPVGESCLGT